MSGGIAMAVGINEKFLSAFKSNELLLKLTWEEWLTTDREKFQQEFFVHFKSLFRYF